MTVTDPVALLRDLIACPSVTPDEGGALTYLAARLREAGFEVHLPVFQTPGEPAITNLYARLGPRDGNGPRLAFAGHTDVVPPGDPAAWSHPPFSGAVADGAVWGRGAVDMKGGIAAFLAAALDRVAAGPLGGSLAFLITGDEEATAVDGTVRLLAWAAERGERFDACIVGEPTNPDRLGDALKVGRRGSLSGTLTVAGRQGHVAYPHRAVNPIPPLLALAAALVAEPLDAGNDRFDPSNLEIVSIDTGNPAWNVIPAKATARFNIRFNDIWSRASLAAWIDARLSAAAAATGVAADWRVDLEPVWSASFLTRDDALIAAVSDAVAAVTGRRPELSTSGGTSDARFIKDYCPVVEFGLVGRTMHQVDERVAVADLRDLTRIYAAVLDRYFPR
jgi:succinyl-diaminopimelate desuccinylase